MVVIRPINEEDWDALWDIAHKTGPGFSSLQPNEEVVRDRLKRALLSFNRTLKKEEALYFFVLEEIPSKKIMGVTAIEAALGLDEPWYNFRMNTVVHASQRFDIYNQIQTLTLCNDYTGCSELCTLFLLPEYRGIKGAGQLLSKSRFLFIAAHLDLFNERIIAELRGVSNDKGESPFWEAIGRKFIGLDFIDADRALSRNHSSIIGLMPRHTIYTNMLPEDAQKVIGKTHEETLPALKILELENMVYRNYLGPFDAGPVIEAHTKEIRAVKESFVVQTKVVPNVNDMTGEKYLISNDQFSNYRCIIANTSPKKDQVTLSNQQAEALNIEEGDLVRLVTQYPQEK